MIPAPDASLDGLEGFDEVQAAVDELSVRLDLSVLIENRMQRPVWWATRGPVDGTRARTILDRHVDAPVAQVVQRFNLARSAVPVRTPAMPELDMWARWCMPVALDDDLLGLLWVLDPDDLVQPDDFREMVECARRAAEVLSRAAGSRRATRDRRDQLLQTLLRGPDLGAAEQLVQLERLRDEPFVQVDDVARRGGWLIPNGLRVRVAIPGRQDSALSGAPLPLIELHEARRRAVTVRRVVRAGAALAPVSWDALGAWRLIVDAPESLDPAAIHPGAGILATHERSDLLRTARTLLDLGGDVAATAGRLHLHRTTLYYRLDRIVDLTGVDLRDGTERASFQLALWLMAYRAIADS